MNKQNSCYDHIPFNLQRDGNQVHWVQINIVDVERSRRGVELPEGCQSLDIRSQIEGPLKPFEHHNTMVFRGLRVAFNWAPIIPGFSVDEFFQSVIVDTISVLLAKQRIIFLILVQFKVFWLCLQFSCRFKIIRKTSN